MIEIIKLLGLTTIGPILLIIIIGFWGKQLIIYFFGETIEIRKKELAQELELHKQKLQNENDLLKFDIDKNLESYKNKLEILKLEYNIQYSKLHERRSVVIEDIYNKLIRLHRAIQELTSRFKTIQGNINEVHVKESEELSSAFSEFHDFYNKTKIYFKPETCQLIENLSKHIVESYHDYIEVRELRADGITGEELSIARKKSIAASDFVRLEIPKLLNILEDDFRKLLGVINPTN